MHLTQGCKTKILILDGGGQHSGMQDRHLAACLYHVMLHCDKNQAAEGMHGVRGCGMYVQAAATWPMACGSLMVSKCW